MSNPGRAAEITTLIGAGTRFEGKLAFDGAVRVEGVFVGEIRSDETLIVGDGAEVRAEIEVGALIVRGGEVHGNVRARESIELFSSCKVVGNLHAPQISIERGAQFQGRCRMEPLD